MLIFDIETGPLPDDELKEICRPFDRSQVKVGNLKDKAKIKAKQDAAEASHFAEFKSNAALYAHSGRVVVIGFYVADPSCPMHERFTFFGASDERETLDFFWCAVLKKISRHELVVGHNILGFDLPFLVRRSWMLGVSVPPAILSQKGKWNNWNDAFFDTMLLWKLNDPKSPASFDLIGKALGTGGKCEGDHGAHFHELWNGSPDDHQTAIQYLRNDVEQIAKWLVIMGRLEPELAPRMATRSVLSNEEI